MEETSAPSPRTALIVLNVDKSYTRREPSSEGNQNDTQFIELVPYLNPQRGALHVQMRRTIQMRECTVFCIPRIGLWLRPWRWRCLVTWTSWSLAESLHGHVRHASWPAGERCRGLCSSSLTVTGLLQVVCETMHFISSRSGLNALSWQCSLLPFTGLDCINFNHRRFKLIRNFDNSQNYITKQWILRSPEYLVSWKVAPALFGFPFVGLLPAFSALLSALDWR